MTVIDDLSQEMAANLDGGHAIRDKAYHGVEFGKAVISAESEYGACVIERVRFVNCAVSTGRFSVYGTATLRDVAISEMRCDDFTFGADSLLDNVSITGGRGSRVWVKAPIDLDSNRDVEGVRLRHPTSEDGVCLDLSKFLGEVQILHADPKNIRIDPERHSVFEYDKMAKIDWMRDPTLSRTEFGLTLAVAGLSETGFFITSVSSNLRVALKKLRQRGVMY